MSIHSLTSTPRCDRCKNILKSYYLMPEYGYNDIGEKRLCEDCYKWDLHDPNSNLNKSKVRS